MVICDYWLKGKCKFGDSCRNEHRQPQNNYNRFAPLQNAPVPPTRGRSGGFGNVGGQDRPDQFGITTEGISLDLADNKDGGERPIWPFSAYAPGRDAPKQLLEGQLEQSPEEMRVQCYLAQATGQPQEYIRQEEALLAQVNQQIQAIKKDLVGARRFIQDALNQHPNRLDFVQDSKTRFPPPSTLSAGMPQQQTTAFGRPAALGSGIGPQSTSTFGQPSGFGAAKPALGAPSSMSQTTGGFGQPSQLGSSSAFGKPSAMGGGSSFGQPSSMGQSNPFGGGSKLAAFGQPSSFGTATGTFGAASQPNFGQSSFGAPSKPAFGAPSMPTGGFGTASKPAFGAPSQPGNSFGQTSQEAHPAPFGQPNQPIPTAAFGQPSQSGSQPQQSAFGQNSQPANSQSSGFGALANKPSPFGSQPQQSNPFAATTQSQPTTSSHPFLKASSNITNSSGGTDLFGRPSAPTPVNGTSYGTSTGIAAAQAVGIPGNFRATIFHNQPIVKDSAGLPCIFGQDRKLTRVWFPDGPPPDNVPNPSALADFEAPPDVYEGPLGNILKEIYETVLFEGTFKDGIMPEKPPKREWVGYDL